MYPKQIFLTTIANVLITFVVAYVFNYILFRDIFLALGANNREQPIFSLAIVALVIHGVVLSYLYPFYYKKGYHPVSQGVKFSLIVGAIIYGFQGFAIAAKYNVDPIATYLLFTLFLHVFQAVFIGIAMGLIFGEIEK